MFKPEVTGGDGGTNEAVEEEKRGKGEEEEGE
jgi:hypothetical protein